MLIVFLKKIITFLKRYWKIISLVVAGIVSIFIFKRKIPNFAADFSKLKQIQDDEIEKINLARKEEIEKKLINKQNFDNEKTKIENESSEKQLLFDSNKRDQVNDLIETSKTEPSKLSDELSKVTGFVVITPKDE